MTAIKAGDTAPDFERKDHNGDTVRLADYRGKSAVVVYFYPKDETPVCTRQACAFRDSHSDFENVGAEVIGISNDSDESHRAFAEHHGLPFRLVSDPDGSLRKAFGVPRTLGVMPGRVTYVIDHDGTVRHVFNSQFSSGRHVREALDALR